MDFIYTRLNRSKLFNNLMTVTLLYLVYKCKSLHTVTYKTIDITKINKGTLRDKKGLVPSMCQNPLSIQYLEEMYTLNDRPEKNKVEEKENIKENIAKIRNITLGSLSFNSDSYTKFI